MWGVMGYHVMVLVAWFPSGTTQLNRHECKLSEVGTHPDMTLDVARTWKSNNQPITAHAPQTRFILYVWIIWLLLAWMNNSVCVCASLLEHQGVLLDCVISTLPGPNLVRVPKSIAVWHPVPNDSSTHSPASPPPPHVSIVKYLIQINNDASIPTELFSWYIWTRRGSGIGRAQVRHARDYRFEHIVESCQWLIKLKLVAF